MPDDGSVTLAEINRNVIRLQDRLDKHEDRFVRVVDWEDNRREVGRRIGAIENELAEKRKVFTTNFLYPLLMLAIGIGAGAIVEKAIGG
jgi:hypothetical protein